ncbi:MAG: DNA-directed RNA polymerase subunit alpha [Thermoanaerobaculaceae bacterium]
MRTLEMVKPRGVEFDRKVSTPTYGVFSAQPFERGWGVTLGNALRRILLSSIEGAAMTAIRISGVAHELDSVPGLVEDVTDFILNIKKVPLRLHEVANSMATISVTGPGTITAADIKGGAELEIIDGSVYLGQLAEPTKLEAELLIERGRGWRPAEEQQRQDLGLGTIFVDSAFSPVTKANFRIEPARVGQATDYEKLTLEIWTNGAISPSQALHQAVSLLAEHLAIFASSTGESSAYPKEKAGLDRSIEALELTTAVLQTLRNAGINTIRDLISRSDAELLEIPRLGKSALATIKKALDREGLVLGMPVQV